VARQCYHCGCEEALNLTYIAVASEVLKQLDLSQGTLSQDFLAEDIGDLLDGNALASLNICGSAIKQRGVFISA
jgi:hypothetical protein